MRGPYDFKAVWASVFSSFDAPHRWCHLAFKGISAANFAVCNTSCKQFSKLQWNFSGGSLFNRPKVRRSREQAFSGRKWTDYCSFDRFRFLRLVGSYWVGEPSRCDVVRCGTSIHIDWLGKYKYNISRNDRFTFTHWKASQLCLPTYIRIPTIISIRDNMRCVHSLRWTVTSANRNWKSECSRISSFVTCVSVVYTLILVRPSRCVFLLAKFQLFP